MQEAINDPRYEYSVLDLTTGNEFMFDGDYDKTISRIYNEITSIESEWVKFV